MTSPLTPFADRLLDVPLTKRPRLTGIYFLIREDVVVYVGQSIDIEMRVAAQWSRTRTSNEYNRIEFDRAVWMPVAQDELDAYEAALILALTPEYNTSIPGHAEERRLRVAEDLQLPPPDLARLAAFRKRRSASYNEAQQDWRNTRKDWEQRAALKAEKRRVARNKRARRLLRFRNLLWQAVQPFVAPSSSHTQTVSADFQSVDVNDRVVSQHEITEGI